VWRVIWIVCTRNEIIALIPLIQPLREWSQSSVILYSMGL
jgi:hypothetical protein